MALLLASALALALAFCSPQVTAFPTGTNIVTRGYDSSSSNSSGGTIAIVLVGMGIFLTILISTVVYRARKRREQERNSGGARQMRTANTRATPASSTSGRRTTINYTSIAERSGNSRVEMRGAENNSARSTRQARVNRRQTQNSTRSLPVYNEQAPDGDVVLLERVRSMSDNEEGHSEDETENTPLTGAAPPYTDSDLAPGIPRVTITTTDTPRGSLSSIDSLHDHSGNPGSGATTTASSINATERERTGAGAPTTSVPTANTATPPYGDAPTYEEATATSVANEVANTPTRAEQSR
ncbi:unnamed protein product [Rhizoctonia solani]|uniref:Uncharacterized protein n=1 Tax=Rhizoctonia solani TaxID=456999 RepID=A0A8H3GQL4_9AGAM|nr:unnamed protein product [Rhizoctonia solani]